jgi:hypothetical protein
VVNGAAGNEAQLTADWHSLEAAQRHQRVYARLRLAPQSRLLARNITTRHAATGLQGVDKYVTILTNEKLQKCLLDQSGAQGF